MKSTSSGWCCVNPGSWKRSQVMTYWHFLIILQDLQGVEIADVDAFIFGGYSNYTVPRVEGTWHLLGNNKSILDKFKGQVKPLSLKKMTSMLPTTTQEYWYVLAYGNKSARTFWKANIPTNSWNSWRVLWKQTDHCQRLMMRTMVQKERVSKEVKMLFSLSYSYFSKQTCITKFIL